MSRLAFLSALSVLAPVVVAQYPVQKPEDINWSDRFSVPGVQRMTITGAEGFARTLALGPGGELYVGGFFPQAGGVETFHIARWDGTWHAMGGGTDEQPYVFNFPQAGVYFAGPPPNGDTPVKAIAVAPDGRVYIGGHFSTAGGAPAWRVAVWDGQAWAPLASGLGTDPVPCKANYHVGINCDEVMALAVAPNGDLYAAGQFRTASGVAVQNIARWDGAAWRDVGGGISGEVRALAVMPDGTLYAGGAFLQAGGRAARGIARWDGTAWHDVGGGVDGEVNALAVYDGVLYVGGHFSQVAGKRANNVAAWNGQAWRSFTDGVFFGAPRNVSTIAADASGIYVGMMEYQGFGYPRFIGSRTDDYEVALAHWDGSDWIDLSPINNEPSFNFARHIINHLYSIVTTPDDVYVGGYNGVGFGATARYHKATKTWYPIGGDHANGFEREVVAGAIAPDGTVYVGGSFAFAGDRKVNHVAKWNGTRWEALGNGLPRPVFGMGIAPDGRVYASTWDVQPDVTKDCPHGTSTVPCISTRVYVWDGQTWTYEGGANGWIREFLFGGQGEVYALAASNYLFNQDDTYLTDYRGVARLENGRWIPMGDPLVGPFMQNPKDMALGPDGRLWVVAGIHSTNPGLSVWDGQTWTGLVTTIKNARSRDPYSDAGYFEAVEVMPSGDVYVGGTFTEIDGYRANNVARWDGTRWYRLAAGVDAQAYPGSPSQGMVAALARMGNTLFVAGFITSAYESDGTIVKTEGIARWKDESWSALGSGVRSWNTYGDDILMTHQHDLYWGGYFAESHNHRFAHWMERPVVQVPAVGTPPGAQNVSLTPVLAWHPLGRAQQYRVQIAAGGFGSGKAGGLVLDTSGVTTTQLTVPAGVLQAATAYDWRIQGLATTDTTAWSASLDFTTTATSTEVREAEAVAFALYAPMPNPSSGAVTLRYTLATPSSVRLMVFDVLGREVARLVDDTQAGQTYDVSWNDPLVASGLYMVRLEAGGRVATRTLTRIR